MRRFVLTTYFYIVRAELSPYNQGSIRHQFIVAYRPLSCHIKNAISYFFCNFSQKTLAGLKIKS